MFNINNQSHLTALKELVLDPLIGTSDILEFINGPGVQEGIAPLLGKDLMLMIFQENISGPNEFKLNLLFSLCGGTLDCDMSGFRLSVKTLNDVGLNTRIDAHKRTLSKAEELFSGMDDNGTHEFVIISREDWFAARKSGGM